MRCRVCLHQEGNVYRSVQVCLSRPDIPPVSIANNQIAQNGEEVSDEDIERCSKGLVDNLFPQVLQNMEMVEAMSGKETLKKHENRVYDLLEEKIAARRKELETL